MIDPEIKPEAVENEVDSLKNVAKEEYIDFKEINGDDDPDNRQFETEEEFKHHREEAQAPTDRFYKAGKLAFQITDTIIPRAGAALTRQSHKTLQAEPEDKEDIIRAYEAVFEYYDYDFDNPIAALVLVLFFAYGLKIIDASKQKRPAPPKWQPAEPIHVEQEDVEDAEDAHEPPPGTKSTVLDGGIDVELCHAEGCTKILEPGQMKYCSNECRMKGLNKTKRKKGDSDE